MSKRRSPARHHGFVVIDKPVTWTSHDVVARVRRIVGERRVGHAGTLDPAASGVLPIAVGLATRTVEYLADDTKTYRAEIRFGISTDSHDRDGCLTAIAPIDALTGNTIHRTIEQFVGAQWQVPPMLSAKQRDGQRMYELARKGVDLVLEPRRVTFHSLRILDWAPPNLLLDIECSKGTYIRSLARDLGERLGTGAYLASLVRTRSGPFDLGCALTLEQFSDAVSAGLWKRVAFHPEWGLLNSPILLLDETSSDDWRYGRTVAANGVASGAVRVYGGGGYWLGVGQVTDGQCKPSKVVLPEVQNE